MIFSFKHFQFDCEQQILRKNGNTCTFNEKPAQLLTLFLREPDKIHNKADILEYVWPDRVVTEQVVFQNISYLRALFGNDAIKTFVKKGYQWQLPLTTMAEELSHDSLLTIENDQSQHATPDITLASELMSENALDIIPEETSRNPLVTRWSWVPNTSVLIIGLLLGASLIYALWLSTQTSVPKQRTLVTLAFDQKGTYPVNAIENFIRKNQQFNLQVTSKGITNQALFDSPFLTWKAETKTSDSLVLATRFYDVKNGCVLRFHIQGMYRGWQGYVFSATQHETIEQLTQLIELLADSEYFSVKSEHLALSKLNFLHNSVAENSLITFQLIKSNYELGYLDRATALADTLLESMPNRLNLGLLHLLKSKIILRNTNWKSAKSSITEALKAFNILNLPHLESLTRIDEAWYEVHNNNYPQIRKSLNFAISKARIAEEPLQEMLAHLIQSSLASKDNQPVLMRNELESARQLFEMHQLADEHQIPMLYTLAAAETAEEKLSYYLTILERPFSPLYSQRFYYSAEKVRNSYIEKKLWEKATSSIKLWQRRSFVSLTKSRIAFAKQDKVSGIQAAIQAFRHAQIDYELQDALNAALFLLEHKEQGADVMNPSKYIDYIKQNANHRWLRDNKSVLDKLSLLKGVTAF